MDGRDTSVVTTSDHVSVHLSAHNSTHFVRHTKTKNTLLTVQVFKRTSVNTHTLHLCYSDTFTISTKRFKHFKNTISRPKLAYQQTLPAECLLFSGDLYSHFGGTGGRGKGWFFLPQPSSPHPPPAERAFFVG